MKRYLQPRNLQERALKVRFREGKTITRYLKERRRPLNHRDHHHSKCGVQYRKPLRNIVKSVKDAAAIGALLHDDAFGCPIYHATHEISKTLRVRKKFEKNYFLTKKCLSLEGDLTKRDSDTTKRYLGMLFLAVNHSEDTPRKQLHGGKQLNTHKTKYRGASFKNRL